MKKIIFITFITILSTFIFSCDCDGDYIEEARSFDKDTALMYVWLNNQNGNLDYLYFKQNGDYRYGETTNDLKINYQQVWYVKNNIIYYREGGEAFCAVRESNFGKYFIKKDTLTIKPYDSSNDSYDNYIPRVYVKISKHP